MNRKISCFILLSFCTFFNIKADVISETVNESLKHYSDSISKINNLDSLPYPENLIFVENVFPINYELDSIQNIYYIYDIKKEPTEIKRLFKRGRTLINVYNFLNEDRLTIRLFLYGVKLKKNIKHYYINCWHDYFYKYNPNTKQWEYIGNKMGGI